MQVLAQFIGGEGNIVSMIVWVVLLLVLFMVFPRLMFYQIITRLERSVETMEEMTKKSKGFLIKESVGKPTKRVKDSIDRFFEFFVIGPVELDPYGIVKKLDHIVQLEKERFHYFVNQIAQSADSEKKASLEMGFAGGLALNSISKIMRHWFELTRKTKNIQFAMLVQMQLPLIEKIAKAYYRGVHALTKAEPIGDSLGPYVAATYITKKPKEIEEDIVMGVTTIKGRKVFVIKARGPGGRLGRPGKAVEKLIKQNKISRIITIDAAAKLEGEKAGTVAEGVGVAMGGVGVERSYIEGVAVKNSIPLDSVIVKMSIEQAITPMRKVIKDSLPAVRQSVEEAVLRSKKGGKIILVGVGNTSGVGDTQKEAKRAEDWIEGYERRLKAQKQKKK